MLHNHTQHTYAHRHVHGLAILRRLSITTVVTYIRVHTRLTVLRVYVDMRQTSRIVCACACVFDWKQLPARCCCCRRRCCWLPVCLLACLPDYYFPAFMFGCVTIWFFVSKFCLCRYVDVFSFWWHFFLLQFVMLFEMRVHRSVAQNAVYSNTVVICDGKQKNIRISSHIIE